MKNKLTLNIDHPNARRVEHFLTAVEEDLTEVPFDKNQWRMSDRINAGCKFISNSEQPITINVVFCDSYHDANEIGRANNLQDLLISTAKWGINGDILYLVESENKNKMRSVLSIFAGEE